MYVGKPCNANPTSTYPPCYALLDISTELLKWVECVVLAFNLQHGMWIAVPNYLNELMDDGVYEAGPGIMGSDPHSTVITSTPLHSPRQPRLWPTRSIIWHIVASTLSYCENTINSLLYPGLMAILFLVNVWIEMSLMFS